MFGVKLLGAKIFESERQNVLFFFGGGAIFLLTFVSKKKQMQKLTTDSDGEGISLGYI
jgi:hypothetical protein